MNATIKARHTRTINLWSFLFISINLTVSINSFNVTILNSTENGNRYNLPFSINGRDVITTNTIAIKNTKNTLLELVLSK